MYINLNSTHIGLVHHCDFIGRREIWKEIIWLLRQVVIVQAGTIGWVRIWHWLPRWLFKCVGGTGVWLVYYWGVGVRVGWWRSRWGRGVKGWGYRWVAWEEVWSVWNWSWSSLISEATSVTVVTLTAIFTRPIIDDHWIRIGKVDVEHLVWAVVLGAEHTVADEAEVDVLSVVLHLYKNKVNIRKTDAIFPKQMKIFSRIVNMLKRGKYYPNRTKYCLRVVLHLLKTLQTNTVHLL